MPPTETLLVEGGANLGLGKVSFGGIVKEVCLAYVPEVGVGDYVIVHAGFAISQVDEAQAEETFTWLAELGLLDEELGRGEAPG